MSNIDPAPQNIGIHIEADISTKITFATHQCDIPLINSLILRNCGLDDLEGLTVVLQTSPPVIAPKSWKIDRLDAGSEIRIKDRRVSIDGGLLANLTEKTRCDLTLEVVHGEQVLATDARTLTALARNEWGGSAHMPDVLAAFILPNDPAVQRLLIDASEVLARAGKNPSLEGYQSRSRSRSWEIVSAIWTAVTARQLIYAEPPASFESQGQKIRLPSDIEQFRLATCLDTALFFAAAIEQAGLYPVIAFTKGHAFCGAWLQPQHLDSLTTEDSMELRKAVTMKELVLFETTMASGNAPAPFHKAVDEANRRISEETEANFVYALDVKQARARQIEPLPSFQIPVVGETGTEPAPVVIPALGETPNLPGFDLGIEVTPTPDTPDGRVQQWRRKLLDLTKRNRLLNLRGSSTAILITCPDPAALEDRLAQGKKISIIPPMVTVGGEEQDPELYRKRTGDDLQEQFAKEALERDEIVSKVPQKELENGVIQLFRKAKSDLQEGGANTLFLAIGMLRWRPAGDEKSSYRAPLILLPVKLERKSAASKVRLSKHEDDAVFNLTLLEMLRQDFHVNIPTLEAELPQDQSGVDVALIWETVRRAVRTIPGFEVVPEVVLSTFSFAKYLMWKDLSERTDDLKKSSIVNHLIETPRDAYENSAQFLRPDEIDDHIDPSELYMPLNSDSSQVVAVHASAQAGDFVLEGPPGTGKSETIGNIIAHNLALGRRVLFVSEKMAALNVVYSRLKDKGLGDFCLELHSNKANKREVIEQLGHAWEQRTNTTAEDWHEMASNLKATRDQLNNLIRALHKPGKTGISPRKAIARTVRYAQLHRVELHWGQSLETDDMAQTVAGHASLVATAKDLGLQFSQLEPADFERFQLIGQQAWSYTWQRQAVQASVNLLNALEGLVAASKAFTDGIKLAGNYETITAMRDLNVFTAVMADAVKHNLGFGIQTDAKNTFETLDAVMAHLESYRAQKETLTHNYDDAIVLTAPLEQWRERYAMAASSSWPFRPLRRMAVTKAVRLAFSADDTLQPEQDISTLQELRAIRLEMDAAASTMPTGTLWRGLQTDLDALGASVRAARMLRKAMLRATGYGMELGDVRSAIAYTYVENRELLQPGMPIAALADTFSAQLQSFEAAYAAFCNELVVDSDDQGSLKFIAQSAEAIVAGQNRLNLWCNWIEARRNAEAAGLAGLVSALENGQIGALDTAEAFKTAYCAWIAPLLIDQRPELNRFSSVRHEEAIRSFRKLDQDISDLTSRFIRAKLSENVPSKDARGSSAGFSILSRELQKKMQHKPIRQLVSEMGESLLMLTPCIMMSPLSVAQFLPADSMPFDLVVFDEASQITVWDAVGAIARGKNAIIVGDPKQMPPTNFFDRGAGADGDGDDDGITDLESILDEALSARVRHHRLTGHYRSRHESLIAFSNYAYYGSQLVTYPAPVTRNSAVQFKKVDGIYGKGKDRTNPIEAQAVVAEVVRRLRCPELSKFSIGVVTLNSEQMRLIEDLLDQERRKDPELEPFFSDDGQEPVFVKNLETVQGDQRDVILLSVGYGPSVPGAKTMAMNFGPLNKQGGERRLNVAITRATTEMMIFASFDSSFIDLSRTSAKAVQDLKHYMEFAERGPVALGEAVVSLGDEDDYDSDFEFAVAEQLRHKGWSVRTQIGVSKFRIDLGIVHPDKPGDFLAGVECDGAAYHSSPSARDRDRVRHIILESLGWKLLRIWSTDFFADAARVIEKIDQHLTQLLDVDRAKAAFLEAERARQAEQDEIADEQASIELEEAIPVTAKVVSADASLFYDPEYMPTLKTIAADLIDQLGPITFAHLSQQIARLHGFQRTGTEIKKVVWSATDRLRARTRGGDGQEAFWPQGMHPQKVYPFRGLKTGDVRRDWSDVPFVEKLALAMDVLKIESDDHPALMARELGLSRLRSVTREEFESLLVAGRQLLERDTTIELEGA